MDHAAARTAKSRHHAQPADTPKGMAQRSTPERRSRVSTGQLRKEKELDRNSQTRYPCDLQFHGGAVIDSAQSHAIYRRPNGVVHCHLLGESRRLLRDLGRSELIHTVDQYVGLRGDHRYTVGQIKFIKFKRKKTPLTDVDVPAYVHTVASKTGQTGYGDTTMFSSMEPMSVSIPFFCLLFSR